MIGDNQSNAILQKLTPTGRKVGGVLMSRATAKSDQSRAESLKAKFESVGSAFGLPPAVLAAIASRESNVGALLKDGYGDGGKAFGIMQVDTHENTHIDGLPDPYSIEHITQATQKLHDFFHVVSAKHPSWLPEQQLLGAISAYNQGPGNIQTLSGMDSSSTGGDYGNDAWARALFFAGL